MRHSQGLDLTDPTRPLSLDASDTSWAILRPQSPSILNLTDPAVSTVSFLKFSSFKSFKYRNDDCRVASYGPFYTILSFADERIEILNTTSKIFTLPICPFTYSF